MGYYGNDHSHRGEYADERHDHYNDYAERHHRHYDEENAISELRSQIAGLREDLRDVQGELAEAFDRHGPGCRCPWCPDEGEGK